MNQEEKAIIQVIRRGMKVLKLNGITIWNARGKIALRFRDSKIIINNNPLRIFDESQVLDLRWDNKQDVLDFKNLILAIAIVANSTHSKLKIYSSLYLDYFDEIFPDAGKISFENDIHKRTEQEYSRYENSSISQIEEKIKAKVDTFYKKYNNPTSSSKTKKSIERFNPTHEIVWEMMYYDKRPSITWIFYNVFHELLKELSFGKLRLILKRNFSKLIQDNYIIFDSGIIFNGKRLITFLELVSDHKIKDLKFDPLFDFINNKPIENKRIDQEKKYNSYIKAFTKYSVYEENGKELTSRLQKEYEGEYSSHDLFYEKIGALAKVESEIFNEDLTYKIEEDILEAIPESSIDTPDILEENINQLINKPTNRITQSKTNLINKNETILDSLNLFESQQELIKDWTPKGDTYLETIRELVLIGIGIRKKLQENDN